MKLSYSAERSIRTSSFEENIVESKEGSV